MAIARPLVSLPGAALRLCGTRSLSVCGQSPGRLPLQDADAGLEHARAAQQPQVLYPSLAFHARALLAAGRQQEADIEASQLLAILPQQGILPIAPDWSGDLTVTLQALGRGTELVELLADAKTPTPWLEAAAAVAAGNFEHAANLYDHIGARC